MEIKWDDVDPNTGKRRWVKAEYFAGKWEFACRRERRGGVWEKWKTPSREMWESLLEALERRLPRTEGIDHADVKKVKTLLANFKEAPSL